MESDRVGLVSAAGLTIFGPLAPAGLALKGVGWVLLGLDVASRRRVS